MRVLWLTPELPYAPGGSGGSTRQFHLLRRLRELGHEVAVVAPVHETQRAGAEALKAAGIELASYDRPASRARETLTALARRPQLALAASWEPVSAWQADVFWTRLRALAAQQIACGPDVIGVEHDWAAAWSRELPAAIPRALTLQNVSPDYYATRSLAARGLSRWTLRAEARRFARHDRRQLAAFQLLIAMSESERAAAARLSVVPCIVVPNGVDTTALRPAPAPDPADGDGPALLFTGTLSYPPNAEALDWILDDIWPRVRAAEPRARLLVVGRDAPERARARADASVTFAGHVPDMAPWFAQASVVLAPVRSGGGTRLKVLDALAAGRALVATRFAADGIDVRDGEHVLFADDANGIAQAALRALRDDELRCTLGTRGRRLAEERYDWRSLGDRLAEALQALAERGLSASARS